MEKNYIKLECDDCGSANLEQIFNARKRVNAYIVIGINTIIAIFAFAFWYNQSWQFLILSGITFVISNYIVSIINIYLKESYTKFYCTDCKHSWYEDTRVD